MNERRTAAGVILVLSGMAILLFGLFPALSSPAMPDCSGTARWDDACSRAQDSAFFTALWPYLQRALFLIAIGLLVIPYVWRFAIGAAACYGLWLGFWWLLAAGYGPTIATLAGGGALFLASYVLVGRAPKLAKTLNIFEEAKPQERKQP